MHMGESWTFTKKWNKICVRNNDLGLLDDSSMSSKGCQMANGVSEGRAVSGNL